LQEHRPVKILIQNCTSYAIRLQTIDILSERCQFGFQRWVTAVSYGVPDVLGKETVRANTTAFGDAVHFERSPEGFHFSNEAIEVHGIFSSPDNVYEPNPLVVSDEHVVGRAFGRLLEFLHFEK
jgi:hypothetical protein